MPGTGLIRGRVYAAVFEHIKEEGEKYYLVVSNNRRNEHNIVEIYPDEVKRDLGALTANAMARIADGLRAAIDP